MLPLEGISVLDFTRTLAGPFCTMILGDLGADVIKIEQAGTGDEVRSLLRYKGREEHQDYFYNFNRNKKSITLNYKHPEGKAIALDLARQSHILVENSAPGALKRAGLSYEDITAINPRIIYCSISGFGQTGPWRDRRAYDAIIQAQSGLMNSTGHPDGPPTRCSTALADLNASLYAVLSILAALRIQERHGTGQHIDISMLDCLIALQAPEAAEYLAVGQIVGRMGNETSYRSPQNAFVARDGVYIKITTNQRLWPAFCRVMGLEELQDDPRFRTNYDRTLNRKELNPFIAKRIATRPAADWEKDLLKAGVPCSRILGLDEVLSSDHTRFRDMVMTADHPFSGTIRLLGFPFKLSATPAQLRLVPPLLGEHTDEILSAMGKSSEEIKLLREKGAI